MRDNAKKRRQKDEKRGIGSKIALNYEYTVKNYEVNKNV